jgi:hypothetical protein
MLFFDILQSYENFIIGGVILLISAGLALVVAPGVRFTVANLVLFLIGGSAGLLTCISYYNRLLADLPTPLSVRLAIIGSILVMFFGAALGGSLSVWLKIRFPKSPQSKRWSLPIGQLIISLLMVQQFLTFGLLGTLDALGMRFAGHFTADLSGVPKLYEWASLVASFSLDLAALLSLVGAALSIVKPSKLSARIWGAGVVCYWIFIAGDVLMYWSLKVHSTLRYLGVWDLMPCAISILVTCTN